MMGFSAFKCCDSEDSALGESDGLADDALRELYET